MYPPSPAVADPLPNYIRFVLDPQSSTALAGGTGFSETAPAANNPSVNDLFAGHKRLFLFGATRSYSGTLDIVLNADKTVNSVSVKVNRDGETAFWAFAADKTFSGSADDLRVDGLSWNNGGGGSPAERIETVSTVSAQ